DLYFRDYLIKHKDIADEYGKLKLSLLKKYKHNRDGYTEQKTQFIQKYTEKARKELEGKYLP
ncbi:MAG: GrpB family protein, partial [Bacilli bacterium]|nr:GrpB family protein [Bacilli bacterium]